MFAVWTVIGRLGWDFQLTIACGRVFEQFWESVVGFLLATRLPQHTQTHIPCTHRASLPWRSRGAPGHVWVMGLYLCPMLSHNAPTSNLNHMLLLHNLLQLARWSQDSGGSH